MHPSQTCGSISNKVQPKFNKVQQSLTKFNKVQQSSTKPKDNKKHFMWQSCDSHETIFSPPPLQRVPSREQEGEGGGGGRVEGVEVEGGVVTDKVKLTKCRMNLVGRYQFHSQDFLASFPGSLHKTRGGESLVTSAGKVDLRRLVLAVPIRLQNGITCTRDILSTQQKLSTRK